MYQKFILKFRFFLQIEESKLLKFGFLDDLVDQFMQS